MILTRFKEILNLVCHCVSGVSRKCSHNFRGRVVRLCAWARLQVCVKLGPSDVRNRNPMRTIVANFKMNLLTNQISALTQSIAVQQTPHQVVLCPPFPYLSLVRHFTALSDIAVGAQTCAAFTEGAHTGEVSAQMLKDVGCSYVIIGHSERRQALGGAPAPWRQQVAQAHAQGLTAICCVGETLQSREEGATLAVLAQQLEEALPETATAQNTMIAYEPVWAIGTGRAANVSDVHTVCAYLKERHDYPVLYGGSVHGDNAAELSEIETLDGFLVGGASLDAQAFGNLLARTRA